MRASGNGLPEVCANNLLRMYRGEVPFERIKGLDARLIDAPITGSQVDIEQDAEFVISNYEPRVLFNSVEVSAVDSEGGMEVTANVTRLEE